MNLPAAQARLRQSGWPFWCWAAVLLGLPFSNPLVSVGLLAASGLWLLEGGFAPKWERLRQRPAAWVFLGLFGLHLLGMAHTEDLAYGLADLRKKLPLLAFPLILGSLPPLDGRRVRALLWLFLATLWASMGIGLAHLLGWFGLGYRDIREISPFVSHIRLALMLVLGMAVAAELLHWHPRRGWARWLAAATLLAAPAYLLAARSHTGLVVLGLVAPLWGALALRRRPGRLWLAPPLAFGALLLALAAGVWREWRPFAQPILPSPGELESRTQNGRPYLHDPDNLQIENGHPVGLFLCPPELRAAWQARSATPYDSIAPVLIRYLSSKGERKDSAAVARLAPAELRGIERGQTNHRFPPGGSPRAMLYDLLWQWQIYRAGDAPNGHSLTQRLVYWQAALAVLRQDPWLGVGTGDVKLAFERHYLQTPTGLLPEFQHRAHNQWLTFAVALGLPGALLCLLALLLPPFLEGAWRDRLWLAAFAISALSFFNEDTLETQAGVTFFAFFYTFFLWNRFPAPES